MAPTEVTRNRNFVILGGMSVVREFHTDTFPCIYMILYLVSRPKLNIILLDIFD